MFKYKILIHMKNLTKFNALVSRHPLTITLSLIPLSVFPSSLAVNSLMQSVGLLVPTVLGLTYLSWQNSNSLSKITNWAIDVEHQIKKENVNAYEVLAQFMLSYGHYHNRHKSFKFLLSDDALKNSIQKISKFINQTQKQVSKEEPKFTDKNTDTNKKMTNHNSNNSLQSYSYELNKVTDIDHSFGFWENDADIFDDDKEHEDTIDEDEEIDILRESKIDNKYFRKYDSTGKRKQNKYYLESKSNKSSDLEKMFIDDKDDYEPAKSYDLFKSNLDTFLDINLLQQQIYEQIKKNDKKLYDVIKQIYLQSKNQNKAVYHTMYVLEQFLLMRNITIDVNDWSKSEKFLNSIIKMDGNDTVFDILKLIINRESENEQLKNVLINYINKSIFNHEHSTYLLSKLNKTNNNSDLNYIIKDFDEIKNSLKALNVDTKTLLIDIDEIVSSLHYLVDNKDFYPKSDFISIKNSFEFIGDLNRKIVISKNFDKQAQQNFFIDLQQILLESNNLLVEQKSLIQQKILKDIKIQKQYFKSMGR